MLDREGLIQQQIDRLALDPGHQGARFVLGSLLESECSDAERQRIQEALDATEHAAPAPDDIDDGWDDEPDDDVTYS